MIEDKIYHQCWDEIKTTVRAHIKVGQDKLQTARQWALQGYVVDKPTPEHVRGAKLWTNANCGLKCLYYFRDEVRKGTSEEIKAFFAHTSRK